MSINISQLLTDTRTLVTRLHDRDYMTDTLLSQTHTLNTKIKCMKEYKEDINEFTDVKSHHVPKIRSAIVHNLQQENRHIKLLEEENRQLKIALEEHQAALDLIMHRYRQQVLHMVKVNDNLQWYKDTTKDDQSVSYSNELNKMTEFARVVDRCLKMGEDSSSKVQEELSRLQAENQMLRQLLKIAAQNDSAAAKTFIGLLRRRSSAAGGGNDSPNSSDDQHTPTSETVDLNMNQSGQNVDHSNSCNYFAENQNRTMKLAAAAKTVGRVINESSATTDDSSATTKH